MTRVPPKIVDMLEATTRTVRDRVITALPDGSSDDLLAYTLQQVLGTCLRDWLENGNRDGLTSQDVQDLRGFIRLAATIADLERADTGGLGAATYKPVLAALLEDWLANWNADGASGPPASESDP